MFLITTAKYTTFDIVEIKIKITWNIVSAPNDCVQIMIAHITKSYYTLYKRENCSYD